MATTLADVAVSIAQVAAGGTLVQGVMAFVRRRPELRQLDRQTDSVAVDTASRLVVLLRTELETRTAELNELAEDKAAEQIRWRRQVQHLSDEIARISTDLSVARAEIIRLKAVQPGRDG